MIAIRSCYDKINISAIFVLFLVLVSAVERTEERNDIHRVYTYVHDHNTVNEELIRVWMKSWRDAGWEPRVLNPVDAKLNKDYEKLLRILDKADICCSLKDSYIGRSAMASLKTGGFYSELYVFPLHDPSWTGENDKFTSHDIFYGSLMSGTNKGWNELHNLLMNMFEKEAESSNFVRLFSYNLRQLIPSNFLNIESTVASPHTILSEKQFEVTNICDHFEDNIAIRFPLSEISGYGFSHATRPALVQSWISLYKARCKSNRPVIFSYESVHGGRDVSLGLLQSWKEAWHNTGWEPYVLTIQDAKRHPRYAEFVTTLNSGRMFKDGKHINDFNNYMRWVAVAASGGGWYSDYEVVPLNFNPNSTLPNDGKFTGHQGTDPTFMSGYIFFWNRMAGSIFLNFLRNKNEENWNDALALKNVHDNDMIPFFNPERNIKSIDDIYTNELEQNSLSDDLLFDLEGKCQQLKKGEAIRLFSSACHIPMFCDQRRVTAGRKWYESWLQQCYEKET